MRRMQDFRKNPAHAAPEQDRRPDRENEKGLRGNPDLCGDIHQMNREHKTSGSGTQILNCPQKRRYFAGNGSAEADAMWRVIPHQESQPMSTQTATPAPVSQARASAQKVRPSNPKNRQQAMEQGKITVKEGISHYVSAFEPRARHPVFEMRLSLASEVGMRLFLSTCEPAQRSLYSLYCLAPIVMRDDTSMLDDTLTIVEQRFEAIETELNNEWQRLRQVAETDGADGAARYVRETPLVVDVMTPAMARYLGLVSTMDGMTRTLDALWFAMRVTATERNTTMLDWRNQIVRFQRELSRLQKRLFEAVRRKSGGQAEADASADAEVAEAFALAESGALDEGDEGENEDDADSALPEPDALPLAATASRRKPATRKRAVADAPAAIAA